MILIEAVIAQMAISIDREILAEEQKEVSLEIESERLRSNLLRAISHDLRTPLAGISGAISTIIKNKNLIDEEVVDDLLNGVFEDTQWLIRLVENLLSMTRIDEGRLEVKKSRNSRRSNIRILIAYKEKNERCRVKNRYTR